MVSVQPLLSSDVTESVSRSSLLQAASWKAPSARAAAIAKERMLRMRLETPDVEVGVASTC
jgi:hypothetical protein